MYKILIIIFLSVFFVIISNAQQLIIPEKEIYRAEDGKLYVQKSLPIYLWLANSPDENADMTLLKSDTSKIYTNPLYLDEEGLNSFRSPWAVDTITKQRIYPRKQIIFEVYADSRSPYTTVSYGKANSFRRANQYYYDNGLTISLSSKDALSGVKHIYISMNENDFTVYNDTLMFTEEKEYTIKYYAVDNVGNVERLKIRKFKVDITNPVTELIIKGDKYENIISGRSSVVLKANDAISGVSRTYYSLDSGKEKIYKYPIKAYSLSEGEHIISYYSVDNVKNKENIKTYTFFIDKTPPILVEEILGNSFVTNGREYSSGRTKLKLTAVDNKAGIQGIYYSLNKEKYQQYDQPFYLSSVSGSLAVVSYAVDNVNNKSISGEKSTKNRASYVDLTGPVLKYDFDGPLFTSRDTIFINHSTKINLKAIDNESGLNKIIYSIDNGNEEEYSNSFTIEQEGVHRINYTGFDNVNNTNINDFTVMIDNKGPKLYSRFSILPIEKKEIDGINIDVYSSHVVLFLSATDAHVPIDKIYYSTEDGKEKLFTGLVDGFKRGKVYDMKIKAKDKLGNQSEDIIHFAIDNTGPEIYVRFSILPVGKKEIDGKNIDIYPEHVSLFVSVTNAFIAYDKIYYSINGATEKLYTGIIEGFRKGAEINMKIRAIDKLGNQTEKEIRFVINE
ncbi:MAG: hypothetical protein KAT68_11130 [Bacteroidales bacterium]|nr:hypothetical protein [Bacteroidales bacterium]